MKNLWTKIGLVIIGVLLLLWIFMFKGCQPEFDTKPYEHKIDSLENRIDSIKSQNFILEDGIIELQNINTGLTDRIDGLKEKVWELKGDLKDAEQALVYTPTQVDSFFVAQYPLQFASVSTDTTQLPLEVSKQIVVDIKQLGVAKEMIVVQDKTITTFDTLIKNKDQIIVDLKKKEENYIAIDKDRVEQGKNYQIQIDGLKKEVSKKNWKLKMGKFEKVIIGVAGLAAGILIK